MKTLGQLATIFAGLAAGGFKSNLVPVLGLIGTNIQAEVQSEIGEYQTGIGGYPATAQLADSTLDRKARAGTGKGGNPDAPLWATGAYHDSIDVRMDIATLSVEIGSNDEKAIRHELGTDRMPPRPVFGPSTMRALPPLIPAISAAASFGIKGGVWSGLSAAAVTYAGGRPIANIQP